MAKWAVTAPDGAKYEVEATSQPEAIEKVKMHLAAQPAAPSATVGSMAKAAGSGLVRGLSGVAGLPGDLMGIVDAGVRNAPRLIGYPAAKLPQRTVIGQATERFVPAPPTTEQVTSSVEENVTGPLYQPQNTAEKYMSTATEFLPAALAGPGRAAAMPFRQAARQAVRRAVPQAVAPAMASETAGQMAEGTKYEGTARFVGALGPSALNATRRRPALPGVAGLEATKERAYRVVDNLGVHYTPAEYGSLVSSIRNRSRRAGINAIRHADSLSMIDDIENTFPGMFAVPGSPTLSELDEVRKRVREDLSNDPRNGRFAEIIMDSIDAFMDVAGPSAGRDAAAMRAARQANTQWRKAELLEGVIDRARRQTQVTGSAGNVENNMRQSINRILNNPAQLRSFSAQERALMHQIVDPDSTRQDVLRRLGKMSPQGNGLMLWGTIIGSLHDPTGITPAVGALGAVSKLASEGTTRGRVNDLEQLVQTGRIVPSPLSDAARQAATMSLLQGPRTLGEPLRIELNYRDRGKHLSP